MAQNSTGRVKAKKTTERCFRIEISGSGGEYAAGVVNDPKIIELIEEYASLNDEEILSENEIEWFEYDNIVHCHGAEYNNFAITVNEINPESNEVICPVFDSTTDDSDNDLLNIRYFQEDEPNHFDWEEMPDFESTNIVFGGYSLEKGLLNQFIVKTNGDDFDINKLLLGTISMEELFDYGVEIVNSAYYVNDKDITDIFKETYGEKKFDERIGDDLSDYLTDEYHDELREELQEAFQEEQDKKSNGLGAFAKRKLEDLGADFATGSGLYFIAKNKEGKSLIFDEDFEDEDF